MAILHHINAYLSENYLTDGTSDDYKACIVNKRTLNIRQICESSINRGRAGVSVDVMQLSVEMFLKEMANSLYDGYKVDTGWFMAEPEIRGLFDKSEKLFSREKHSILFRFNQGAKLRAGISSIDMNVLEFCEEPAIILKVTDEKSGSVNDLLTPGCHLTVAGSKIKVAGHDTANGICFFNTVMQIRTAVKPSDIAINTPSELVFMIPELVPGEYVLEIATQFAPDGALLEEPFTTVFDKILSVE